MDSKLPSKVQSNEDIVDEITKNLEESCVKEDDAKDDEFFDVGDKLIDAEQGDDSASKNNDFEEIKNDPKEDEYFVDETALKDRDLELTEDQIQVGKQTGKR